VQVVVCVSLIPTISISSLTLTIPASIRPVTTVPRPEIENTSSIGIINDLSVSRLELPKDVEMVMPGDYVKMEVELLSPIAMEEGLRFAIREGGRTVGAGVVAKVID
jgi:hypothetical protein